MVRCEYIFMRLRSETETWMPTTTDTYVGDRCRHRDHKTNKPPTAPPRFNHRAPFSFQHFERKEPWQGRNIHRVTAVLWGTQFDRKSIMFDKVPFFGAIIIVVSRWGRIDGMMFSAIEAQTLTSKTQYNERVSLCHSKGSTASARRRRYSNFSLVKQGCGLWCVLSEMKFPLKIVVSWCCFCLLSSLCLGEHLNNNA